MHNVFSNIKFLNTTAMFIVSFIALFNQAKCSGTFTQVVNTMKIFTFSVLAYLHFIYLDIPNNGGT